jgi:hypothetical protein
MVIYDGLIRAEQARPVIPVPRAQAFVEVVITWLIDEDYGA